MSNKLEEFLKQEFTLECKADTPDYIRLEGWLKKSEKIIRRQQRLVKWIKANSEDFYTDEQATECQSDIEKILSGE